MLLRTIAASLLLPRELSRLGRSLGQIIQAVDQLLKKGVSLIAIKESIRLEGKQDLQTKVTIALFGLFAEIERDLISERTKEGLAAARARGRLLGRPKGSLGPSKLDGKEGEIQMLLGKKVSKASIAKILDVAREHAALVHPIASPRTQEATTGLKDISARSGRYPDSHKYKREREMEFATSVTVGPTPTLALSPSRCGRNKHLPLQVIVSIAGRRPGCDGVFRFG